MIYCSDGAATLLGLRPDDIIGRGIEEVFCDHADSDDTAAEIVAEEVAESEVVEAAEEVVDTEVLETVEAEEASTLSVASDASVGSDDGIETVRAGLQDWVSTVVLNTTNSKSGE